MSRFSWPFDNPNHLGTLGSVFLGLFIPFVLSSKLRFNTQGSRYFPIWFFIFLSATMVVVSGSRGAVLAALLTMVVIGVRFKSIGAAIIYPAGTILLLFLLRWADRIFDLCSRWSDDFSSHGIRLLAWKAVLAAAWDSKNTSLPLDFATHLQTWYVDPMVSFQSLLGDPWTLLWSFGLYGASAILFILAFAFSLWLLRAKDSTSHSWIDSCIFAFLALIFCGAFTDHFNKTLFTFLYIAGAMTLSYQVARLLTNDLLWLHLRNSFVVSLTCCLIMFAVSFYCSRNGKYQISVCNDIITATPYGNPSRVNNISCVSYVSDGATAILPLGVRELLDIGIPVTSIHSSKATVEKNKESAPYDVIIGIGSGCGNANERVLQNNATGILINPPSSLVADYGGRWIKLKDRLLILRPRKNYSNYESYQFEKTLIQYPALEGMIQSLPTDPILEKITILNSVFQFAPKLHVDQNR